MPCRAGSQPCQSRRRTRFAVARASCTMRSVVELPRPDLDFVVPRRPADPFRVPSPHRLPNRAARTPSAHRRRVRSHPRCHRLRALPHSASCAKRTAPATRHSDAPQSTTSAESSSHIHIGRSVQRETRTRAHPFRHQRADPAPRSRASRRPHSPRSPSAGPRSRPARMRLRSARPAPPSMPSPRRALSAALLRA